MEGQRDRRLITRVMLKNYKSIKLCDVRPAQLSFLVGRNGSGKSNFLDALRFTADSLHTSPENALEQRGGIACVRRRCDGPPAPFAIRLEFNLGCAAGHYAFSIGAREGGGGEVRREECLVQPQGAARAGYVVEQGRVLASSLPTPPAAAADRLFLVNASGFPEFRPLYDALCGMGFYNISPEAMRAGSKAKGDGRLRRDGANAACVFAKLARQAPLIAQRIGEYLAVIEPGITGVEGRTDLQAREYLEFHRRVCDAKNPQAFYAHSVADGTLRAFGVLLALLQGAGDGGGVSKRRLIAVEEPAAALHPAIATAALLDALGDAAEFAQVFAINHSPELLDNKDIPIDSIFAVEEENGETRIGPLGETCRSILKDRLYYAGELLQMNQLEPDPALSQPRRPQFFENSGLPLHAGN